METFADLQLAHVSETLDPQHVRRSVCSTQRVNPLRRSLFSLLIPVVLALTVPAIAQAQVLQTGQEGAEVTAVQSDLQRLGYSIDVDGVYGEGTAEVVEQFQSEYGLSIDGQVGPETRHRLLRERNAGSAGTTPYHSGSYASTSASPASGRAVLRRGDQGAAVRQLQELLCKRRYPCAVTGVFDQQTEQSVLQFQRDNNLVVDGIVGPQTWTALGGPSTPGGESPVSRSYVVLIPMDTGVTLGAVRRVESNAFEQRGSRLGPYIHVAAYADRGQAQRKVKALKAQGFDAQVRRL
jgi:peptidoglycan hydrolase-like protein with peptidoglycan-binding domain